MRPTDKMPTIARLVAGLMLAGIGWVGSDLIRPLAPEGTDFGWFNYVNAGIGLICGWKVIGMRLGDGYTTALSTGLTGIAALVFWALFGQAFYLMITQSLRRRYDGPGDAFNGLLEIVADYAQYLLHPPLLGLLIGGGLVVGLVAEWLERRGA